MPQRKKGPPYRLEGIGLDDRPFLYYLHVLIFPKKNTYFIHLFAHDIKLCNFQCIEHLLILVFLLSRAKNSAVGNAVDESLKVFFGFRGDKNMTALGADDYNDL